MHPLPTFKENESLLLLCSHNIFLSPLVKHLSGMTISCVHVLFPLGP